MDFIALGKTDLDQNQMSHSTVERLEIVYVSNLTADPIIKLT